jgi:hypothetical protein
MSVTFSYQAYFGNDGSKLSYRESLAGGAAYIRNQSNPLVNQGLPAFFQAQKFASRGLFANQTIEEELRARRIFLFNIYVLDKQPLPLFQGKNMRSSNQDFASWGNVIIIVEEEEEDEEEENSATKNYSMTDLYPALFR